LIYLKVIARGLGVGQRVIPHDPSLQSPTRVRRHVDDLRTGRVRTRTGFDRRDPTTLSGGEKQRLAFARIFLHNPDIIVLDEATAALDPESQDKLMELLSKQPESTALVSVGHRPELEAFHNRKVVLERRKGGAKLVSDIKLVSKPRLIRRWLNRRKSRRTPAKNSTSQTTPARA
jgi:putative ATP-binding cassette transporter